MNNQVREELDSVAKSVGKLFNLISTIRNDQLRALASSKTALCLSCGRGDVNFIPPEEYVSLHSRRSKAPTGSTTRPTIYELQENTNMVASV
jgi:hypothetical protein